MSCPDRPKRANNTTPGGSLKPSRDGSGSDSARSRAEIQQLTAKITDLTSQNPRKAATILSAWLTRPSRLKKAG
jgi:hypothetical protein